MQKNPQIQKPKLELVSTHTMAHSEPHLLFFQFECPHCQHLNIMAKIYVRETLICSHTGCRKIITLTNYKEIA
jgi:transcription elongation factor Elf1